MRQLQEFCANARPICKTRVFLLKIYLSLQKVTNTYVQLHGQKNWAGNVRIGDLRCSRRGLFAKVVILATQKINPATAYVRGCFFSIVWGLAPRNSFGMPHALKNYSRVSTRLWTYGIISFGIIFKEYFFQGVGIRFMHVGIWKSWSSPVKIPRNN